MENVIMKLEFWTKGSNFRFFTYQVCPLAPVGQIKRHGEGQRKETYSTVRVTLWEEIK
jgi:hypothetical protein